MTIRNQGSVADVIGRRRAARSATRRPVPHPTVAERKAKGRAARDSAPPGQLATWREPAGRADPVSVLIAQEESRVQGLLPVRHARMATSAFAFYRGSAGVMAADLAVMPLSGLAVQLCGDAHLANFGLFAAPDRSVVFDVNDFDETLPGPFEWHVMRLATSFALAARDSGLPARAGSHAAEAACTAYREAMAAFAGMPEVGIWYDRVDVSALVPASGRSGKGGAGARAGKERAREQAVIEGALAKARSRDAWSAIARITEVVDGHRRFRDRPPLLTRLDVTDDVRASVNGLFREYRATLQDDRQDLLKRYAIIDMGHKVVGVGSVGLLAFVLLLRGRDEDDLMVLQVKQAQASVLEPYTRKSAYRKHGHRVVTGQRLMQAASDSFLGWLDAPGGRSFYVRQLRDMKWSPDPSSLTAASLPKYARLCGHTLARGHARSGDAIALAAYLGKGDAFDKAVAAFAHAYCRQVEADLAAFTAALADGRIQAHEDAPGSEGRTAARLIATPAPNARPPARKATAGAAGGEEDR